VVYVKGRRAGGTHGMAVRAVELALRHPRSRHVWVDLTQRHIFRAVRRFFARILRGTHWRWDAAALVLSLPNGSTVDFGSAQRPELLEGFGYDYLWINEAGHLLRDEALYFETLLPMVLEAPDAQIFLVGAPKGRGLFQRMFEWGADPEREDWQSFRHPSSANGLVSGKWLERVQRQMPERTYRQEILAEFVDDEGRVFRDPEACATAPEEPAPQPGAAYVIGIDLGRHQDWTVAWVGRAGGGAAAQGPPAPDAPEAPEAGEAGRGQAVHCERFQALPWPLQQARLSALCRRYHDAPLVVDATGIGDAVCDALEADGLAVERVRFTQDSKGRLVDRLAIALERGTFAFAPHEQTLRELQDYRYALTPAGNVRTGGSREHDDCVMALALCCWGLDAQGGRDFILGAPMVTRELD
jgi:hypothetical protein